MLIFSFFAFQPIAFGAIDTVRVKDLSDKWVYYDSWDESYMPLVRKGPFQGNTIHFTCEEDEFLDDYLQVTSSGEVTVFVNNKLIHILNNDTLFIPVDEIRKKVGYPATVTLYATEIVPSTLSTYIVRLSDESLGQLADVPLTFKRKISLFSDFFTAALVFLLICTAILYNYFPRVFVEYFKTRRAFSLREIDENLLKSKPVSQVNFLVYVFFSLMAALVIISLIHLSQFTALGSGLYFFESFSTGIWEWVRITLIVFVWLVVKFILITNTTWLFRLGNFSANHFYNYIRLNFLMLFSVLIIAMIFYYAFGTPASDHYRTIFYLAYVLMGLQVIVISLKLMATSSFKKVHLFSYLCTTELMPYGILLSIGFNQPY